MKKIDKEFLLSDSSVNSYGFRLLTSGYQMQEFARNPIGYYMHDRDGGVVVRWEDLRIEGDRVYGKPIINEGNSRGKQTIDEVESGFLNAASFGHFVILETSEDVKDMLPGQIGPTVTKWYNRECSLVDIPANYNALTLFDKNGHQIHLADFTLTPLVKKVTTEVPVSTANSIEQLLKTALDQNDITPENAAVLRQQYKDQPSKLKKLLDEISSSKGGSLVSMDWDELDKKGLLEELKQKNPASFHAKFHDKFGKIYQDAAAQQSRRLANADVNHYAELAIKNKYAAPDKIAELRRDFGHDPKKFKELIDALPQQRIAELMDMSWEELDDKDLLEELKEKNLSSFKQKFRDQFGKECRDKNQ